MELKINYTEELEFEIRRKIRDMKKEFDELFGDKVNYTYKDKQLAMQILDYYSRTLNSSMCMDYLAETLKYLETHYKGLFQ